MGNAFSGVLAGYFAVHKEFLLCSFFVVLGFIFGFLSPLPDDY